MADLAGLVCVGGGDRLFKVGFVEVQVYHFDLYVDQLGAAEALGPGYAGSSHKELCGSPEFYDQLVRGHFRKTFRLTFLRSVPCAKVQTAFRPPLMKRVSGDSHASVGRFVDAMQDMNKGDIFEWCLGADGEQVELFLRGGSLLRIASSDMWLAAQRVFFDEDTEMPAIKAGAVQLFPDVVFGAGSSRSHENPSDGESAVRSVSSGLSLRKKTWREFSKREKGKEGYKFGDVSRGLVSRARTRKGFGTSRLNVASNMADDPGHTASSSAPVEAMQQRHADELAALARSAAALQAASLRSGILVGMILLLLAVLAADSFGLGLQLVRPICMSLLAVFLCMATKAVLSMQHVAEDVASSVAAPSGGGADGQRMQARRRLTLAEVFWQGW